MLPVPVPVPELKSQDHKNSSKFGIILLQPLATFKQTMRGCGVSNELPYIWKVAATFCSKGVAASISGRSFNFVATYVTILKNTADRI